MGRLYINCFVTLDLRTTRTISIHSRKTKRLKRKVDVGSERDEKIENTYIVLLQHVDIPFGQVFTPLVVVHALDPLAFGEVVSDDTSFHGPDPRFSDMLLTSFQFRCIVIKRISKRRSKSSAKEETSRVHVYEARVSGTRGCGWYLPSMSAALVSSMGIVGFEGFGGRRRNGGVLRRDLHVDTGGGKGRV